MTLGDLLIVISVAAATPWYLRPSPKNIGIIGMPTQILILPVDVWTGSLEIWIVLIGLPAVFVGSTVFFVALRPIRHLMSGVQIQAGLLISNGEIQSDAPLVKAVVPGIKIVEWKWNVDRFGTLYFERSNRFSFDRNRSVLWRIPVAP